MISCKETNIGSAKTIENNLGIQTDLIYIEAEQMACRNLVSVAGYEVDSCGE